MQKRCYKENAVFYVIGKTRKEKTKYKSKPKDS